MLNGGGGRVGGSLQQSASPISLRREQSTLAFAEGRPNGLPEAAPHPTPAALRVAIFAPDPLLRVTAGTWPVAPRRSHLDDFGALTC
jgi:hypothetical protein